eukprot:3758323-Rhodomonas_salina.1
MPVLPRHPQGQNPRLSPSPGSSIRHGDKTIRYVSTGHRIASAETQPYAMSVPNMAYGERREIGTSLRDFRLGAAALCSTIR